MKKYIFWKNGAKWYSKVEKNGAKHIENSRKTGRNNV